MDSLDARIRKAERSGDHEAAKRERRRAGIVLVSASDLDTDRRVLDAETMARIWVKDPIHWQAMFTHKFMRENPVVGCPIGTGNTEAKAIADLLTRSGAESRVTYEATEELTNGPGGHYAKQSGDY